ncbi:MAG: DUF424 family protein [Candidatus Aenigmatarchaeota archaeon]
MFYYNLFKKDREVLLAICDEDILGKTFNSGDLEITISEFYKGKNCDGTGALKLAKNATIINAVGNNIINMLIEKKIVEASSVMKIGGTMHAQVISVGE